ncbi:MAG: alpha-L-rhamnosidase [Lentisphaeria bacterium]|nr:alpha-L-rhamnosidase [Lentisphaeria bacterium]
MLFSGFRIDPRVTAFVPCERIVLAEKIERPEFFVGRTWFQPREILTPDDVRHLPAGAKIVLDFGQELSGGVRIVCGRRAGRIRLRFGESVSEAVGTPNQTHAIHDTELDLPALGLLDYGNTGFRFVCLDALTDLDLVSILGAARYRDLPRAGMFECSDERLNRIWETCVHTVHLCMQDYLYDGVKRDRLAWMGDLNPEIAVIDLVFRDTSIVRETMDFLRDRTPLPCWMNDISAYSLWWIVNQWEHFLHQGDREYLRGQLPYLHGLISELTKYIGADGSERLPEVRFIDWPTRNDPDAVHAGLQALLATAFRAALNIAEAMHDESLQARITPVLRKLTSYPVPASPRKSVNALLALAGLRDSDTVNREILKKDPLSDVGTFMGYYILRARCEAGDLPGALDLIRGYWGAMLDCGATSFWEDFDLNWTNDAGRIDELPRPGVRDIHADCGAYCYKGLRHSLCHGWAGGPAAVLIRYLTGLTILEPGCGKIALRPRLAGLDHFRCRFATPRGDVEVAMDKNNPKPEIILPDSIKATNIEE